MQPAIAALVLASCLAPSLAFAAQPDRTMAVFVRWARSSVTTGIRQGRESEVRSGHQGGTGRREGIWTRP